MRFTDYIHLKVLQMANGLFYYKIWLIHFVWHVSQRNPPRRLFPSPPVITMPINNFNVMFICVFPTYPIASLLSIISLLSPSRLHLKLSPMVRKLRKAYPNNIGIIIYGASMYHTLYIHDFQCQNNPMLLALFLFFYS